MTHVHNAVADVAIVGAGAAGVAAGRTLHAEGLDVCLLEAADRVGGRAFASRDDLGVWLDHGCAWLHCADRNPLRRLADAHGIRYAGNPDLHFHLGGRWLDDVERAGVREYLDAAHEAVAAVGRAGRDVPAASVLSPEGPYAPVRDFLMTSINATPPERYSSADAWHEERTGEDWVTHDGLGRLIAALAEGLDITLERPVSVVAREGDSVRLDTSQGSVRAKVAIVTVSTGVLGAGTIGFDPSPPAARLQAFEQVPMGIAEKVGLRFDCDVLGFPGNSFLAIEHQGAIQGFHVHPGTPGLVTAYAGGAHGESLLDRPQAEAVDYVLSFLEYACDRRMRRHLRAAVRTGWRDNPWIRGSYSAAVPGGHAARAELARPLHERILFAGEATHPSAFTTCHGAWLSGERAAREALALLR